MHPTISHVLLFCWCYHLTNVLLYPSTSSLLSVITFLAITFLLNEEHGLQRRKSGLFQDAINQVNCAHRVKETQTEARTASHAHTETVITMSELAQVQKEVKSTSSQVSDGVIWASTGVQTELKDQEKTSREVQTEQNDSKTSAHVQTESVILKGMSTQTFIGYNEGETENPKSSNFCTSAHVQTESIILKGMSTQTFIEYNTGETEIPKSSNFINENKGLEEIHEPTTTSNATTCDTTDIRDVAYNPLSSQILQLTKLDALIVPVESVEEKLARLNLSTTSDASISGTDDGLDHNNNPPISQPLLDTCLMASPGSVNEKLPSSNLSLNPSLRNTQDIREDTVDQSGSQPLRTESANKPLSPSNLTTWNYKFLSSKTSSEIAEDFSDYQQHLSINPLWYDSESSSNGQSSEPNIRKKANKKSPSTWLKFKNQMKRIESPFRK